MSTVLYILLVLWFAMIGAFAVGVLILVWRTFMSAHPIQNSSEKMAYFCSSAFPKIMRILWWTILGLAIVGATINAMKSSLSGRMRVIDHRWQIPSGEPAMLTDALAIRATESALRASSRDPSAWFPIPWSAQSTSVVHMYTPTEANISLNSNRNSLRPQLYSHLKMDVERRVVRIELYRSK